MAVRAILKFPNPGLRTPAAPVDLFDGNLRQLAANIYMGYFYVALYMTFQGLGGFPGKH